MLKLFKRDKKYGKFTDEELFSTLKEVALDISEQEIQKARDNDGETLFNTGDIYFKRTKNSTKAFAWFYKAALQNYDKAQYQIGYMYQHGYGVTQNYKQAMKWYKLAASIGNSDAQNSIGGLYENGDGVTKNIHTAIAWYTKAAFLSHAAAQNTLGVVYETNDEVQNLQKAINWYQEAADNNYADAKKQVNILNEKGYYARKYTVKQKYRRATEMFLGLRKKKLLTKKMEINGDNDINYDSQDDNSDGENDINYNTERRK